MDRIGDAVQGLINLLDMIGGLVRKALIRKKIRLNEEFRSRDNTWLGAATLLVLGLFVLFLFSCGQKAGQNSPYNASGFDTAKDEAAVQDTVQQARTGGVPVTADDLAEAYMASHHVSDLARSVAHGNKIDLNKDMDCLILLDSMHNGILPDTRSFYFWVVSKSLKWSDGYYAEGVGNTATSYLFDRPAEFLSYWSHLIGHEERDLWAYSLAGEQAIETEGYPADTVMLVFSDRLRSTMRRDDQESRRAGDLLIAKVDSTLRLLKQELP
ncbi:MAG TPA: hypothetical protein PKE21_16455 [Flavobacteriales bacterium]|nr:hypothetical protein [Flavobacteriales bacterium]HMR29070.1 hypothetical protein [Flavobacteriales bacterium]